MRKSGSLYVGPTEGYGVSLLKGGATEIYQAWSLFPTGILYEDPEEPRSAAFMLGDTMVLFSKQRGQPATIVAPDLNEGSLAALRT